MTPDRVHWWQVYATVKWAVICALQASAHLSGATRSVELATIGRRVCESEWDLFGLLGLRRPTGRRRTATGGRRPTAPFGRPTAAELVEAVREHLDGVMERSEGGAGFEARVARNALAIVERELRLGPALAAAHTPAAGRARLRRRRRAGHRAAVGGARRRLGVRGAHAGGGGP